MSFLRVISALALMFFIVGHALAEYQLPSEPLRKLVDRPLQPSARISPSTEWMMILERRSMPSLKEFVEEEWKLGGLRIDPKTHSPSRIKRAFKSITIKNIHTHESHSIDMPDGLILSPQFSPNSEYVSFAIKNDGGVYLYVYNIKKKQLKQLAKAPVNATVGGYYTWMNDSSGLLARLVIPKALNVIPAAMLGTPNIQVSSGDAAPVRTYQDLLSSVDDEQKFERVIQSQLTLVTLDGKQRVIGKPGLNIGFEISPDNQYLLVKTLKKPFSYLVPYSLFAQDIDIYSMDGQKLKTLSSLPVAENIPQGFDSVRTGVREATWRSDEPNTVVYVSALDGGDMKKPVKYHDKVEQLRAPFKGSATELLKTEFRLMSITWGNNDTAMLTTWRFSDRKMRKWIFSPGNPHNKFLFSERSYNDRYLDKGQPMMGWSEFNTQVLLISDNSLMFAGLGASPKGNIPFLDRYQLKSKKFERLWHSEAPYYERVIGLLDVNGSRFITLRESTEQAPNFYIRSLGKKQVKALTAFPHPTPEFKSIKKELLHYERADGVKLTGTLYLPESYKEGEKLPILMWAYPREYKDPSVAGQVKSSPYQFKLVSYWGPLPFLANGFGIFDNPAMPIVGKGKALPNDQFLEQLVMSAQAAVEVLVERGVADPNRMVIGGHSYGAFMVANLLAHSDIFKAGIARSGAYNRSLTPFGFQGEERNFWEAQGIYASMSPFFHAEKINEPMLMIHGEEDNNSGTYPMQSKRMFSALKGLGKTARLVMLPKESHGYRYRESVLHMLWEEEQWLNQYVKKNH